MDCYSNVTKAIFSKDGYATFTLQFELWNQETENKLNDFMGMQPNLSIFI